jgi:non-ribosomal peptide synthetase component E (peptide arylation enzyme)
MNISAEELEGLLLGHPKVREIAVIGAPDPVLGERVCAVVVPQQAGEDPSLDELVEFLRDTAQVAAYKWPEHIVILDALPRNPVGKVLKRILREAIAQPIATAAGQR